MLGGGYASHNVCLCEIELDDKIMGISGGSDGKGSACSAGNVSQVAGVLSINERGQGA